jgi:hypothetical protein
MGGLGAHLAPVEVEVKVEVEVEVVVVEATAVRATALRGQMRTTRGGTRI